MKIERFNFKKMQGTGNDFVVIDNREYGFGLKELIRIAPSVCNRKFGVGADGLLVLSHPQIDGLDYTMIYRNADGSDAGMCGNGARCIALFAAQAGFDNQQKFNVHENIYRAFITAPSEAEITFPVECRVKPLSLDGETLYQVHTGTEHLVKVVPEEDLGDETTLRKTGNYLRKHAHFHPVGTNVNFFCGINESELRIQTYERGVENLTLACGTGAIAAALVWHHLQKSRKVDEEYKVKAKGGDLTVDFVYDPSEEIYSGIKLKGEAQFVFEGVYHLP